MAPRHVAKDLMTPSLPKIENIHALKPPIWARTGHLQTILSHLIPSPMLNFPLEEHIITLKDGDQLKIYIHRGQKPVVITLFHGLAGDIQSDYMQRTAVLAEKMDCTLVLVNHRGAHSGLALAKHPYHSGKGEDASDVFEWLREKFPQQFLLGIGISMSGSILLNLLSGLRGTVKPDAVITVNAPLDLKKGSMQLARGLNRIYDIRFVHRLSRDLRRKHQLGLLDRKYQIPISATLYDFDRIFTGPATEFKTRENYYASCSVRDHLQSVDRPCIMLTAFDDPFVDVHDYLQAKKSEWVQMHIEPTGGHVGYLGLEPDNGKVMRWLDYFLKESILKLTAKVSH